ncbi:uncharacterized protein LOC142790851 isoform X2 [Rhipicephalus microplus]|uniref:uncharacterized protein LOC142790851 isoform X2 n=1 Tax=Rhipicephalus microplus TaxID=6941 RepID=UPI003F6D8109
MIPVDGSASTHFQMKGYRNGSCGWQCFYPFSNTGKLVSIGVPKTLKEWAASNSLQFCSKCFTDFQVNRVFSPCRVGLLEGFPIWV